jgi:hypothetical protein
MKKSNLLSTALFIAALLAVPFPAVADAPTLASGGAGATIPPNTFFAGVAVNGLHSGFGVEIDPDGSARGQFSAVLLGISALGAEQDIKIVGAATGGSRSDTNGAVFSGTATVDMGDGLPPVEGVPFTATVTTDGDAAGTIALVTALASLPLATLDAGSITIK